MIENKSMKRIGTGIATLGLIGVLGGFSTLVHQGEIEGKILHQRESVSCYDEKYKTIVDEMNRSEAYSIAGGVIGVLSVYLALVGVGIRKVGEGHNEF